MPDERYAIQTEHGEEEHSAGGVTVRRGTGGDWEVLIVERKRRRDWSLPKGHLEPGETAEQAALRELEEETGVRGRVLGYLTTIRYPITGRSGRATTKVVHHYLMEPIPGIEAGQPEDPDREVPHWMPFPDALARLTWELEIISVRLAATRLTPPPSPTGTGEGLGE